MAAAASPMNNPFLEPEAAADSEPASPERSWPPNTAASGREGESTLADSLEIAASGVVVTDSVNAATVGGSAGDSEFRESGRSQDGISTSSSFALRDEKTGVRAEAGGFVSAEISNSGSGAAVDLVTGSMTGAESC